MVTFSRPHSISY